MPKHLAALGLLFLLTLTTHAAEKPNVVLIFTDDQGYGDVNAMVPTKYPQPNLDRMAKEGMVFTDFYVNCAVCSGSRTALMTGCHYQRLSMAAVLFPRSSAGLHPNEVTIADMLKGAGYATGCFGKWHLGHLHPCLPTDQGFDEYYGIPYSNDMWIDSKAPLAADIKLNGGATIESIRSGKYKRNESPVLRNDKIVEFPIDQAEVTRQYTEEAVRFIKENKDKPFFVYLPHTQPHLPLYVGKKFDGKSGISKFADIMMEIDWSVGEILKVLKEEGIDDNTLVIFTTDNGTRMGTSGPLRGRKAQMYEGGIRVPTLMRWPKAIPAGKRCSELAATIDILPTLAGLAGAKLPERKIDGKDIAPLMRGEAGAKSPHEHLAWLHGGGAVRSGKWKFYPRPDSPKRRRKKQNPPPKPAKGPKVQLYDLSTDLGETKNVAEAHPEVVAKLAAVHKALAEDIKENKRPTAKLVRE
ncbi:MAG: sulfatase [Pirellulales bacterium]|nr:sulfatase [Pirellulales bacterium]